MGDPTSNAVALVERLRSKVLFWNPIKEIEQKRLRNPDGPEAADVIQSLTARIAELEAENARLLNAFDGIVEGEGGE